MTRPILQWDMIKTLLALLLLASTAAAQPSGLANVMIDKDRCWGTGILVTPTKVLTAYHVIDDIKDLKQVFVHFPAIQTSYVVVDAKVDKVFDLALLTLEEAPVGVEVFVFAERPPVIGEALTVAGFGPKFVYEEDPGVLGEYWTPGFGYTESWIVVHEATARPGDSGGPITNSTGHLVGCLWGCNDSTEETVGSGLEKILEFCR